MLLIGIGGGGRGRTSHFMIGTITPSSESSVLLLLLHSQPCQQSPNVVKVREGRWGRAVTVAIRSITLSFSATYQTCYWYSYDSIEIVK